MHEDTEPITAPLTTNSNEWLNVAVFRWRPPDTRIHTKDFFAVVDCLTNEQLNEQLNDARFLSPGGALSCPFRFDRSLRCFVSHAA
jgi:hypothetical protein